MEGFHEHASKSRLYHAALNVRFTPHEVSILNLRTAEAVEDREVNGDLPQVPPVWTESAHHGPDSRPPEQDPSAKCPPDDLSLPTRVDEAAPSSTAPPAVSKVTPSRLRNLSNKISAAKSHKTFLSTCAKEQLIPKGFRLKWSSHYVEADITTDVLNRASLDLVKSCHQLVSRKLSSLS